MAAHNKLRDVRAKQRRFERTLNPLITTIISLIINVVGVNQLLGGTARFGRVSYAKILNCEGKI